MEGEVSKQASKAGDPMEVFVELSYLAEALGVAPLKDRLGLWECDLGDGWEIAVNGHEETLTDSRGGKVEPFVCRCYWHGWPAGEFSPYGGYIAAGSVANLDSLLAAIRAATGRAREGAARA